MNINHNKGIWHAPFLPIFIITVGLVANGLQSTFRSGVLQNNLKVVGCKAMNNGENYCNEKYNYSPKYTLKTLSSGGVLRERALRAQGR